ncbi:PH domain-containing protein [Actinoplanes sp. DH11]|uniref:PH domain-containing protein n=1 Tax=Actinoplanes sp. DH11 TaxID=2857011 RepID=UPI001E468DE4|nr:PH domain-containing protein [Actinoplanes sp. DH11]
MTAVIYRPKKIRVVAIPVAVSVALLFTVLSFGLTGSAGFQNQNATFQRGDQLAMIGLGILIGLGVLAFCRPRVVADERGIRVRNVIGGYDLPWEVVRAVRFDRNSAWAQLELHDDEQVAVHALQAVDKDYAVEGVRTLRALHSAAGGA